ncbi:bifunctional 5,10-methylenetetrahydrofolate dehydrogenase/5,10-methenyltetrahydrofolate cyclohydrolase [Candidatus Uhrbacteria bacterium]|nr:bifunctional 5,10-methylenetetrahydrofolate dehydrogenase/5,10-methenyltetrahydrofolate cyclohydrolase [Candidatus Uhrbacteria bacterium]
MQLIDGRALAAKIHAEIKEEIQRLKIVPGLGVILVGENPASEHYVELKKKKAEALGFYVDVRALPSSITQEALHAEIINLNSQSSIHGFILQLPLPSRLDKHAALNLIDPKKDADGLHPLNLGNLARGAPAVIPATPRGILALIESTGTRIEGAHAVVVGRSAIVGLPTALMLTQRNATVTICHSHTKSLAAHTQTADILVVAAGHPGLVRGDMLKGGACVIDVGSTPTPSESPPPRGGEHRSISPPARGGARGGGSTKWLGDVDFASTLKKSGFITPVPGGVGPMTVAMLLKNTIELAKSS